MVCQNGREGLLTMKGAAMAAVFKPGEDNKRPGEYVEVGPRGGAVPDARVVHIDAGDRLPPTQEEGHRWRRRS